MRPLSALGQKATSQGGATSALTPKADINRRGYDVCSVPTADIVPLVRSEMTEAANQATKA
jgi:hypothetical protein